MATLAAPTQLTPPPGVVGKRAEPRVRIAIPIRAWGLDSAGKAFGQEAQTVDVSRHGACIKGISAPLAPGAHIGIQRGQQRGRFKVVWRGEPGSDRGGMLGLLALDDTYIWGVVLPPPRDEKGQPIRPETAQPAAASATLEGYKQACQSATRALEEMVSMTSQLGVDARLARELAVVSEHLRAVAWVVQQYVELQPSGRQYDALDAALAERVREGTRVARALALDVLAGDLTAEISGTNELQDAVVDLDQTLSELTGRRGSR